MLGIIILIFIGSQFYKLAKEYEQKLTWVYAIIGIVAYYAGEFIVALILILYFELIGSYEDFEKMSDASLTIIAIVSGILSCLLTYHLLKKKWDKDYLAKERLRPKISDIGKSEDEIDDETFFLEK